MSTSKLKQGMVVALMLLPNACLEGEITSEGMMHNVSETRIENEDTELRPRTYSATRADVIAACEHVAQNATRWALVSTDKDAGTLHATHTTRIFRWVDDVNITLTETSPGKITVNVKSESRVGKGDLGQNAFNVKDFLNHLDERLN